MKKPKQEQPKEDIPDHHEERVQQFTKKKGHKKEDYHRREDLEDRKYWS